MRPLTYGLAGIYRDEYGTYVWQPRAGVMGEYDIVRVTVCPGAVPERPSFDECVSRARETIRQIRATRNNPKQITAEQLVPEHVRTYYSAFWAGEQNALEITEADRLAKEARRKRMWWWQRWSEVLWVR